MKNYELNYIISPDLSEGDVQNFSERINSFIQEENGELKETRKPSEKNFGFLATLNFCLNPEKLGILEKKLKAEDKILRYLILTKKAKEEIPGKKVLPRVKSSSPMSEKKAKPKKVELKDIDKKIEEILRE